MKKIFLISLFLLAGCSTGGNSDTEKQAMFQFLESCPEGGTLSSTAEITSYWGNTIKLTCTWTKGQK